MVREPFLSVVIPCLDAADTIGELLAALASQGAPEFEWEVVVADNGSTDDTRRIVEAWMHRLPAIRIVDASDREGTPHALNMGATEARGEVLAFLDADDVPDVGWLAAIGSALASHDFVASRHDPTRLNPEWTLEPRDLTQAERLPIIWYPPYLPHSGGCGLGVRRSVYAGVGGFDEDLVCLFETDFCFKVQTRGIPLRFVPDATVHIRFRNRVPALCGQAFRWAYYNQRLYARYRPAHTRLPGAWRRFARQWWLLGRRIPRLRDRGVRAKWMWKAAWQCGLLAGCARFRVEPALGRPKLGPRRSTADDAITVMKLEEALEEAALRGEPRRAAGGDDR